MTQQMIDNAVNDIYPELSKKSNNKNLEEVSDESSSDEFIPTAYEVDDINVSSDNQKTNVWKYVIIAIIIIIIIAIIWYVAYNYFSTDDSDDTTTDISNLDTNIGSIISDNEYYIVSGKLKKKMKQKYQLIPISNEKCPYGYYGNECNLQAHSIKYYNIGNFNSTYTKEDLLDKRPLSLDYLVEDGSKDKNSCTSICDGRTDCKGVLYDHNSSICSLITSNVVASGQSSLDFTKNTQMYLKKSERPQFTDIIIGFSGAKVLRYYLTRAGELPDLIRNKKIGSKKKLRLGIVHFKPNEVTNTVWVPYRVANYGNYIGLFSDKEFTIDNWKDIDMLYVDKGTGEYNIPLFLQDYSNLYVLYISKEDYEK